MVTALGRIEGKPFGIVANNPVHLAGAIDSDASPRALSRSVSCVAKTGDDKGAAINFGVNGQVDAKIGMGKVFPGLVSINSPREKSSD